MVSANTIAKNPIIKLKANITIFSIENMELLLCLISVVLFVSLVILVSLVLFSLLFVMLVVFSLLTLLFVLLLLVAVDDCLFDDCELLLLELDFVVDA